MGLAAAYEALLQGHRVDVFEASPEPGGMAAHFDFGGMSIERFYHFICKSDAATFALMAELGMADKVHWVETSMGFFHRKKLHAWGNPLSLLKLPGVRWADKLRYGWFVFDCIRRDEWPELEHESARDWIVRSCGARIYEEFWRPLLELKYYEFADQISAAWIWTRIRRIGRSRKNLMQEELGYIEGGSKTLVDALLAAIARMGGKIHLKSPVRRVVVEDGRVLGVSLDRKQLAADFVISTVPTPYVPGMIPDLPQDWKARYESIQNISVFCVIFKLKRSVSSHFWINISEPGIEIPGIIEFTNLRKIGGATLVYVPYYMPATNGKFSWTDDRLREEAFACLQRINRTLTQQDVLETTVTRLRYGQPVCDVGFSSKIPPIQTPIEGLQIADTCFYYPEDRGIAESVRLGRAMSRSILDVSVSKQKIA
jgi:protoporphyrinogen oxidase